MDTFESLVEEAKSIARSDPKGKAMWCAWCDTNAEGTKDPRRMNVAMLQTFFAAYRAGEIIVGGGSNSYSPNAGGGAGGAGSYAGGGSYGGSGSWPSPTAGGAKPMPEAADLASVIKIGQRVSQSWKTAWCLYCDQNAGGVYDPSRLQANVLQAFIEFAGAQTLQAMHSTHRQSQQGQQVQQQQLPAKRSRSDGMVDVAGLIGMAHSLGANSGVSSANGASGQAPGVSQDYQQELVEQVKVLQRTDPAKRQMWVDFCDTYGSGIKDPKRHDAATLEAFFEKTQAAS